MIEVPSGLSHEICSCAAVRLTSRPRTAVVVGGVIATANAVVVNAAPAIAAARLRCGRSSWLVVPTVVPAGARRVAEVRGGSWLALLMVPWVR